MNRLKYIKLFDSFKSKSIYLNVNESEGDINNEITLYGVKHQVINDEFNYHNVDYTIESDYHPFGTTYVKDGYGYVANGYKWYKFSIKDWDENNNW